MYQNYIGSSWSSLDLILLEKRSSRIEKYPKNAFLLWLFKQIILKNITNIQCVEIKNSFYTYWDAKCME